MTYDEIVNFVMIRLGNRQNLKGRIESELAYVKEFVLEKDPTTGQMWFLHTTPQDLTVIADQNYVDLPSDFNFESDTVALTLADGVTPVRKDEYDQRVERERNYINESTSELPTGQYPQWYAIVGTRMYLFPTPTLGQTLKFSYFQTTGRLDANPTNPWIANAADLLLNTAGSRVAMGIQHMDQAQVFLASASEARRRIIAVNEERRIANTDGMPE